ncbi:hypothetical protein ACJQWK_10905 [Exserohilum turcicum]
MPVIVVATPDVPLHTAISRLDRLPSNVPASKRHEIESEKLSENLSDAVAQQQTSGCECDGRRGALGWAPWMMRQAHRRERERERGRRRYSLARVESASDGLISVLTD